MRHAIHYTLVTLLLALATQALGVEPPRKYNNSRYYHLFQKSIVTDKPPVEEPEEAKNDLEDWVLVGSKKTPNQQVVTIVNAKDQSQRITVPSKEASELGFAILELKQNRGNFMRTEAHLQKGKFKGWVKYDQKFLALKRAAAPKGGARKPSNNRNKKASRNKPPIPGLNTKSGQKKNTPKKRARVRYVPKPKK